jgi:23S rRNA (uracil1939-C5)-methyltransferase
MAEARTLAIDRLGAQGDGIADTAAGPVFVPFALPGERFRIDPGGDAHIDGAPSPDRQPAPCRHFGTCGGCVAQHMAPALYAGWKRGIVVEALRQHGIAAEVAPLVALGPGTRRRAVLTASRTPDGAILGYHQRRSDALVAITECPLLVPAIATRLPALSSVAAALGGTGEARLSVLATDAGLDVAIAADRVAAGPAAAMRLAKAAAAAGISRVTLNGQPMVETGRPVLDVSGVAVTPPPGGFVQAAQASEAAIARLVTAAAGKARRVADLFAGAGTLTFPLARTARVLAVDSDAPAIAALAAAARHARGLKAIETRMRDLFREPLSPRELDGFDAAVFDPPRAGAKMQAERLARTQIPVVIAVSCNPGTLARDLRALADGGYHIESVTQVDQFLWSAHVEVVAVARRPQKSRPAAAGRQ